MWYFKMIFFLIVILHIFKGFKIYFANNYFENLLCDKN